MRRVVLQTTLQTTILAVLCPLCLTVFALVACAGPAVREAAAPTTLEPTATVVLTVSEADSASDTPSAAESASASQPEPTTVTSATSTTLPPNPPVTITDLYDNHPLQAGLQGDWGFACLIAGYEQTILFDTGSNGSILLSNMAFLGIDPLDIDLVILSHEHGDHTRGLDAVLAQHPTVSVYCPASFSQSFTRSAEAAGATVVRVEAPTSPCPGVTITAPMPGGSVQEEGLLLDTAQGPVFITGCAHPGVVIMAQAATGLAGRPLLAVLGGFHLYKHSDSQVRAVIADLQALGVQRCGPSHCTGDQAIAVFRDAFGPGFIQMGVGAVLEF